MKVLVTGAAGVLGREVVALLAGEGWTVRAHDRAPLDGSDAHEVLSGDLCDRGHVRTLTEGVAAVVHAGAIPSPRSAPEHEVFENNVLSTFHVLDEAGRAGVSRVVSISSLSALGLAWSRFELSPERVPVTEEHPYAGDDAYGLSKQVGELIAQTMSRRWGYTAVSLRFPFIGSGERLRRHLAHVQEDPAGDKGSLWGWIDTRDAARAIAAALTRPLEGHHVITAAAPDTTSLEPTAELLRRYHPDTPADPEPSGYETPFSTARGRELLGFSTVHSWRPGHDPAPEPRDGGSPRSEES